MLYDVRTELSGRTLAYHAIPSRLCGNRFTKTERLAEAFHRRAAPTGWTSDYSHAGASATSSRCTLSARARSRLLAQQGVEEAHVRIKAGSAEWCDPSRSCAADRGGTLGDSPQLSGKEV